MRHGTNSALPKAANKADILALAYIEGEVMVETVDASLRGMMGRETEWTRQDALTSRVVVLRCVWGTSCSLEFLQSKYYGKFACGVNFHKEVNSVKALRYWPLLRIF